MADKIFKGAEATLEAKIALAKNVDVDKKRQELGDLIEKNEKVRNQASIIRGENDELPDWLQRDYDSIQDEAVRRTIMEQHGLSELPSWLANPDFITTSRSQDEAPTSDE